MTRFIFALMLALTAMPATAAFAQDDGDKDKAEAAVEEEDGEEEEMMDDEGETRWGGFGFFSPGINVADYGVMAGDLELNGSLGEGGAPDSFGILIGGGGRLVIGRVIIGGKGFGAFLPSSETELGTAKISGGGGGLDIGWIAWEQDNAIIYPFFGGGGAGYSMTVENLSGAPLNFGNSEIAPGQKADYNTGFAYIEAGVGAQVMKHDGGGGFNFGVEVGAMVTAGGGTWADSDDNDVATVNDAKADGIYVKLTVGGGGFSTP